jgi:class 3 adenylate cyclase
VTSTPPQYYARTNLAWTLTIAKRVCDLAGPAEVFVSETVKGLIVGSNIDVSERGMHILKGVPEEWRLFAVEP